MVEPAKPASDMLLAPGNEVGEVIRSQEAVPGDVIENEKVAPGQADRRGRGSSLKPWLPRPR